MTYAENQGDGASPISLSNGKKIDQRIERARRLLEQGLPLADAALQLGFSDQSHFQRAFKQRVAATPGEYRRMVGRLRG